MAVVLFVVSFTVRVYRSSATNLSETERAILAAEQLVRERLGPGIVTRFPPRNWIKTEYTGDRYIVSSWVEADSKYTGRSITYDYSCAVLPAADGSWYAERIDLQPQ